jgi:hypothetical protein
LITFFSAQVLSDYPRVVLASLGFHLDARVIVQPFSRLLGTPSQVCGKLSLLPVDLY